MPDITISWVAAILGLVVAIVLILKKFNPVYSLFFGAIVGCLIGGASLSDTVAVLLNGTQSIMGTAIRVLAAGMLAGVMMESGAAESIANAIVQKLGEKKNYFIFGIIHNGNYSSGRIHSCCSVDCCPDCSICWEKYGYQ